MNRFAATLATHALPLRLVLPYVALRMLGAFAAALLYSIFAGAMASYEAQHGIACGTEGSEATAMVFGEYFQNPGGKELDASARSVVTPGRAFIAEMIGTAILVLVIFCATAECNAVRPQIRPTLTIGLTGTLIISLIGPLTMAGLDPARDFAPRLFSSIAGRRGMPFSVHRSGWLTVYRLAPIVGGLSGGRIYRVFFRPAYRS